MMKSMRLSDHEKLFLKNMRNSKFNPNEEKPTHKNDPPRKQKNDDLEEMLTVREERIRKLEEDIYRLRMKEHLYIEEIQGYEEEIFKMAEEFRKKNLLIFKIVSNYFLSPGNRNQKTVKNLIALSGKMEIPMNTANKILISLISEKKNSEMRKAG